MQVISAASRLREEVLKLPNTVLLYSAGQPDRVIRFTRRPERLDEHEIRRVEKGQVCIILNLDNGPDSEAWRETMEYAFKNSRRDRPLAEPVPVAPDSKSEWSLGATDVPLVELNAIEIVTVVTQKTDKEEKLDFRTETPQYNCPDCGKVFEAEITLKQHYGRFHKEKK